MNELVVARYVEDIEWLKGVSLTDIKVTVYNKHDGPNLLPNVGREAHTYLWHITQNWDDLGPVIFFTQADPFFHNPEFLQQLAYWQNRTEEITYVPLMLQELSCKQDGNPHHNGLDMKRRWELVFGTRAPNILSFFRCAMFGVSLEILKLRSRNFYQRLLDMSEDHGFAWEMERLWPYIFCGPLATPESGLPIPKVHRFY